MNSKHTQGPWRLETHSDGCDVVGANDEFVCAMARGNVLSDARLIAAAPDMLHTLELAERWFVDHCPPDASALTIAAIIRDSITKATKV